MGLVSEEKERCATVGYSIRRAYGGMSSVSRPSKKPDAPQTAIFPLLTRGKAHTLGVDLKLPRHASGALTLGLEKTKDEIMQGKISAKIENYVLTFLAAMRLRQLGTTQRVVFFAPPEVHQSILDVCNVRNDDSITSLHVVHWLLEQTCRAHEQLQGLHHAQGMDFCHRKQAQSDNPKVLSNKSQLRKYLEVHLRAEQQTIEKLYGELSVALPTSSSGFSCPSLLNFVAELRLQQQAATENKNAVHSSVLEEVEQELEVEFQAEEVRLVRKPTQYKALTFPGLHPEILKFATTGALSGATAYQHVFSALGRTAIGQKYGLRSSGSRLYVSAQFMRTIDVNWKELDAEMMVSCSFYSYIVWIC
jgi:hypothetical protein